MREDFVQSAVQFLRDPKVANASLAKRIEFLESKQLSREEIDEALKRAESPAVDTKVASGAGDISYSQPRVQLQPPPPLPERDWKDYFVMATVSVGVAYGLYEVAKRYVLPAILPPTPAALEADREALEREFSRTEALVQQMSEDTAALKKGEEERAKRFDDFMVEAQAAVEKIKQQALERRQETQLALATIQQLRDQVPKLLETHGEVGSRAIVDLQNELRSLKQLVTNRVKVNSHGISAPSIPPASSVPSTVPGFPGPESRRSPAATSKPDSEPFIPVPGTAAAKSPSPSSTTPGPSSSSVNAGGSNASEGSSTTANAGPSSEESSGAPQAANPAPPSIPAWQLAALNGAK